MASVFPPTLEGDHLLAFLLQSPQYPFRLSTKAPLPAPEQGRLSLHSQEEEQIRSTSRANERSEPSDRVSSPPPASLALCDGSLFHYSQETDGIFPNIA